VVVSQGVPAPCQPSRPITRDFWEAIKKAGDKVRSNDSSLELVRLERASRVSSLSCSFVNTIAGATRNFSLQCESS
jgi:hypothetical protein